MCKERWSTNNKVYEALYKETGPWVKPLLEDLGRSEWGEWGYTVILKVADVGDTEIDHGWFVKKIAANNHYNVGIRGLPEGTGFDFGFFIATGGETLFTENLTEESLRDVLVEALKLGPTNLKPR